MLSLQKINFIFLFCVIIVCAAGAKIVWDHQYRSLLSEHTLQLERFSSHITTTLDKYAHIPRLLAKDRTLVDALYLQTNTAQLDITNRYLERINTTISASDTYLINRQGMTIAASNWRSDNTFIGRNFRWRPYFYQAISDHSSQYFALGSTSGKRGYYYSHPITYAGSILGVIVVKMDLSSIEEHWESDSSYFIATDENQIVFMSSRPEWLLKSVFPLANEKKEQIRATRQYLNQNILPLNFKGSTSEPTTEWLNKDKKWAKGDYIVSSKPIDHIPLFIRVLSPKSVLYWPSFIYIIIVLMAAVILYLVILLIHHRKIKHSQLAQLQSEAKQKLEYQVMERTASLHHEIEERKKTETQLHKTQEELIQAAKLAVLGQMSSSVSHELNNPLSAIRSFADNGRRFLVKEKYERVEDNLQRISALTERMAKISSQLKSFSRRADEKQHILKLAPVIVSAKELMTPQLKSHRVSLTINDVQQQVYVSIDPIQMEQVLVNLLTNAIQALEEQEPKYIEISTEYCDESVLIHIDDNGSGVNTQASQHLFEPFFTTKKNGLGLGLSISLQIIQTMNGSIHFSLSHLGGTRFSIQLPLAQMTVNQGAE